jgi:phenylacetate-CoA ligase
LNIIRGIGLTGFIVKTVPDLAGAHFGHCAGSKDKRLSGMVEHAYRHVPLYREKYNRAGISPTDIKGLDDLQRLPVITKQDLVDGYPDKIMAANLKAQDCIMVATSGSTGSPLRMYAEPPMVISGLLEGLLRVKRTARQMGINMGPHVASITITSPHSLEAVLTDKMEKMPSFLSRSYHKADALLSPAAHIEFLNRYQPEMLFTYPSVMRNIAVAVREGTQDVHQPRLIVLSGELLTENTRHAIAAAFQAPILNSYISTEGGAIASECPLHNGLHIDPGVIVETLKDGRPATSGEPGQVVVTSLKKYATPIIRYAGLGDVAVLSSERCPCGNPHTLMKVIGGRVVDSLVKADGAIIHPFSLTLALEHIPLIASFRIIQESLAEVRVLVVPEKAAVDAFGHNGALAARIKQNLTDIIGTGVDVMVETVPFIPDDGTVFNRGVVISRVG